MSDTTKVVATVKDSVNGFIKHKGLTTDTVMESLKNICETLDVNDKLNDIVKNKTGNDKAVLAVDALVELLLEYKTNNELSEKDVEVIEFFCSSLGRATLMSGVSLLVYTFPHVQRSWKSADLDNSGCVYGKKECNVFFKSLCCCK